jgi:hypothetical protein
MRKGVDGLVDGLVRLDRLASGLFIKIFIMTP